MTGSSLLDVRARDARVVAPRSARTSGDRSAGNCGWRGEATLAPCRTGLARRITASSPSALTAEVHPSVTRAGLRPEASSSASARARGRNCAVPEPVTLDALPDVTSAADPNRPLMTLDERLLTAGEVADLLAVPRSSVYEYARRRIDPLPSLAIGRHRRFERRAIETWLGAQC